MNKKKQMKVFKTVDSIGLINELNEIDAAVPTTFPVIFRPVTEDDNGPVNMAGIGEDNMFVWKDDALGTLLTMHEELWVMNRSEKVTSRFLKDRSQVRECSCKQNNGERREIDTSPAREQGVRLTSGSWPEIGLVIR